MYTRQEKQDRKVAEWTKWIDKTEKSIEYSTNRFDILVITMSSSFLTLSVGYFRLVEKPIEFCTSLWIYSAWIFFAICLISNLLSQVSSYVANRSELSAARMYLDDLLEGTNTNTDRLDSLATKYNTFTHTLNITSLTSIIIGVIAVLVFIIQIQSS